MDKILQHLKTSGIGTTSGMICYSGGQYLNTAITDNFLKTLCLFGLMTAMGVCSKLLMDKIAKKKEDTVSKIS
jgi:hypothetical protein